MNQMMPNNLPLNIVYHLPPDLVEHLHRRRDQNRALAKEVKAALTNAFLLAWKPELAALLDEVEARSTDDDAKVEAQKSTVKPLESALANYASAVSEYDRTQAAWGFGSTDRKENLRLRDDRDHADRVLIVRRRELESAARDARAQLPSNAGIYIGPGRDLVETIGDMTKRWHLQPVHGRSNIVDPRQWERWLESFSESDLGWIALHAARRLSADEKELEGMKGPYHTSGELTNGRQLKEINWIATFSEELAKWKREREVHLRKKAEEAKRKLEETQRQLIAAQGR